MATNGSSALESAGHPVVRIDVADATDLGAEMLRAEIAVAAAGSILGIHPFDQPDVQLAKDLAKRAMAGELPKGEMPTAAPTDRGALEGWAGSIAAGDYLALQAFLAPSDELEARLQRVRHLLRGQAPCRHHAGLGTAVPPLHRSAPQGWPGLGGCNAAHRLLRARTSRCPSSASALAASSPDRPTVTWLPWSTESAA